MMKKRRRIERIRKIKMEKKIKRMRRIKTEKSRRRKNSKRKERRMETRRRGGKDKLNARMPGANHSFVERFSTFDSERRANLNVIFSCFVK